MRFLLLASLVTCLVACDDEPDVDPSRVDSGTGVPDAGQDGDPVPQVRACPGEGCEDVAGEGALEVGAAQASITPIALNESAGYYEVVYNGDRLEAHEDLNGNGGYDPGDGETYEDYNGNGEYDGAWIAGFGSSRGAKGVHDDQWVRAIALRHENTTMAVVSIDCVGYFKDEVDRIRASVSDLDVDYVTVAATHVHEARDTMGIWGRSTVESGVDPEYMAYIRAQAGQAIRDAVAALEPAHVQYASFRLRDLTVPPVDRPDGMVRFVGDNRDPNIVDDEVRVLRFMTAAEDGTIATLVNWAAHPEYSGSRNRLLSSDYPHFIRKGVEQGVMGPDGMVPGVGGVAVFFSGALGGQIGPNHIEPYTWDGTATSSGVAFEQAEPPAAEVVGDQIAYYVLQALGDGGGSVTDETAALGFRMRELYVPVSNTLYHLAFMFDLFIREVYGYDPTLPITTSNTPSVLTEVATLDIGRAQVITVPGELHPELFLGGYDGSHTPAGQDLVDPANPNPPDLASAPAGPYLRDRARPDAEYVLLFGLGNDMLGYLVPEYNYQLADTPYVEEAPGDHYEETNSVGPMGWPTMHEGLVQVLTGP